MQDLVVDLVELNEIPVYPLLKFVQVLPLNGSLSIRCVNHATQLGVICKLVECALDVTVSVTVENKGLHRTAKVGRFLQKE